MRNLTAILLIVVALGCGSAALADGVALHERTVAYAWLE